MQSISFSKPRWAEALYEVEELYDLCSESQGADQLCGYRTAGLRLCFRTMQKQTNKFSHDAAYLFTFLKISCDS